MSTEPTPIADKRLHPLVMPVLTTLGALGTGITALYASYSGSMDNAANPRARQHIEVVRAEAERQKALIHYKETICSRAFELAGDEKPNPALARGGSSVADGMLERTIEGCVSPPASTPITMKGDK